MDYDVKDPGLAGQGPGTHRLSVAYEALDQYFEQPLGALIGQFWIRFRRHSLK